MSMLDPSLATWSAFFEVIADHSAGALSDGSRQCLQYAAREAALLAAAVEEARSVYSSRM